MIIPKNICRIMLGLHKSFTALNGYYYAMPELARLREIYETRIVYYNRIFTFSSMAPTLRMIFKYQKYIDYYIINRVHKLILFSKPHTLRLLCKNLRVCATCTTGDAKLVNSSITKRYSYNCEFCNCQCMDLYRIDNIRQLRPYNYLEYLSYIR